MVSPNSGTRETPSHTTKAQAPRSRWREKLQIQALDRTAPMLPIRSGQIELQTYDYTRHGTTTLFAALEIWTNRLVSILHGCLRDGGTFNEATAWPTPKHDQQQVA